MNRIILLFMAAVMPWTAAAQDGEGIAFDTSKTWQELLSQSAAANKYVFLDCYTSWCGPCKGMSENVFTQKAVGDFMNANFICTKRDMEKGEGMELNQKYKSMIPGYPTYLIIDSKGDVVYQASGYMDADKFIGAMQDALDQKSWIAYTKRYEAGESGWEFFSEYFELLESAYQKEILAKVKAEIMPKLDYEQILESKAAYLIFKKYWTDVTAPIFRQFMSSSAVYRKHKDPEADVAAWAGKLYDRTVKDMTKELTETRSLDAAKSEMLLSDIRNFSMKGREEQIAMLLIDEAVAKGDTEKFFATVDNACEFGMLRYRADMISDLCMAFYADSKDKKILKKCLEYTKVNLDSKMLAPSSLRNYAHFLEKTGDTVLAGSVRGKADAIEKDFKERFGDMFK